MKPLGTVYLKLVIILAAIIFMSGNFAFALGDASRRPDWITSEPVLLSKNIAYSPKALEQQVPCIEMRIFQIPAFFGGYIDRELCVMKGSSFRMAVDQNGFHMFVAFGNSDHFSLVQKDSWSKFYIVPNTDSAVVFRKLPNVFRLKMMIQDNFTTHLSQLENGEMAYDYAEGESPFSGEDIVPSAWALSNNGRYLVYSYGITYGLHDRVVVVDLTTDNVKVIGSLNYGTVYASPAPLARLAISDDASLVVAGGPKLMKVWDSAENCGVGLGDPGLWNGVVKDYCKNSLISPVSYGEEYGSAYDDSVTYNIKISHHIDKVSFIQRRGVNDTTYSYKRISIRAYNVVPPEGVSYLALGDSYSSGEGDVTSDGISHYIPGTNIAGDYSRNIPREMCHISDRSYPFLIAKQMNLSDGAMKSTACSGAVAEDALTYDLNNPQRIHADTYLGQGTQLGKLGGDGPRLTGIAGYEQLQSEALTQTLPGRIQQINHVEKTQPEAITITMGGNDLGFGNIIASCINILNSPLKADTTCWDAQPEGRQARAQQIHDFYPRLKHLYENLRSSTESGNVFVIGYPRFFDENYICADMGNVITRTEQVSLNQLVDYANATIKNAALDAGVKYIDIADVFDGSELCGKPTSMTSINGLVAQGIMTEYAKWKQLTDDNIRRYGSVRGSLVNSNPIFIGAYFGVSGAVTQYDIGSNPYGALMATVQQLVHPNSYGHALIYNRIHEGLGDELLASASCNQIVHCPQLGSDGKPSEQRGAPNSDAYIPGTVTATGGTIYLNGDGEVSIGYVIDDAIIKGRGLVIRESKKFIVRIGKEWLDLQQIQLQSPPTLYIYSTPINLGKMAYDASDNSYSIEVKTPSSVGVGAHTLHIVGKTSAGRDVEIISHTYVMGPDGDIDGDGVADEKDSCAFGEPSGTDIDADGISDNCDLNIDGKETPSAQPANSTVDTAINTKGIIGGEGGEGESKVQFVSGQQTGVAGLQPKKLNLSAEDTQHVGANASPLNWLALTLGGLVVVTLMATGLVYRRARRG